MDYAEKSQRLADLNPEALTADGFEDALVGFVQQFTKTLAVYDRRRCIEILMSRDGMDEEEAEDFFEFNVVGSWVGEHTPCFMTRFEDMYDQSQETKEETKEGNSSASEVHPRAGQGS